MLTSSSGNNVRQQPASSFFSEQENHIPLLPQVALLEPFP